MAYSFNGSDQYIWGASSPVTGFPIIMAAWVRTTETRPMTAVGLGLSNVSLRYARLATGPTGAPRYLVRSGGTQVILDGSSSITDGDWHHILAWSESVSDHRLWADGMLVDSSTTSIGTFPTLDRCSIGAHVSLDFNTGNPVATFWEGEVAEAAYWDLATAFEDIDAVTLSKGLRPGRVRPRLQSLYAPLVRPVQDLRGQMPLTIEGSPTVTPHPPLFG